MCQQDKGSQYLNEFPVGNNDLYCIDQTALFDLQHRRILLDTLDFDWRTS